jgi:single-strand DNA-binding protein
MGFVGKDPEIRYIETRPVATFTLATTERARRLPNGTEVPERTEWHNIVMWDGQAEFAEKYIRKGSRLLVEGKLRTRYWEDRNTIKRTVTEILVDNFDLLGQSSRDNANQAQ